MRTKTCEICGKEYVPNRAVDYEKSKYCSMECKVKSYYKDKAIIKCKNCGKEIMLPKSNAVNREYCSRACKTEHKNITLTCIICGQQFKSNKKDSWRRKCCSRECYAKYVRKRQIKHKSHFWKGGIASIDTRVRNSRFYNKWRNAVFERDKYTCQDCGSKEQLHAHHIIPINQDIRKVFKVENGITLCNSCHKIRHNKKQL